MIEKDFYEIGEILLFGYVLEKMYVWVICKECEGNFDKVM